MRQVLFRLPPWMDNGLPIYGYGFMLFLAFLACTWLAGRRAEVAGIAKERVQDLALWLFVGGLIGSRVVFMIQSNLPLSHFFFIWEGGLVFYGGLVGGTAAYALAHPFLVRKYGLSTLKLADVIAPCAALGLCLGRIGCLLNGCCYGEVACPDCPAIHFPLAGLPRGPLVAQGYQTALGFSFHDFAEDDHPVVGVVEPGSPAEAAGLREGDVLLRVAGQDVPSERALAGILGDGWKRGQNDVTLAVRRGDQEVTVGPFAPRTLGLHPTQLYETISTGLLLLLLLAYYPYRRHDGELFAIFLMLYPLHRFLNEMLRDDNSPFALGLTLSQSGSVLLFPVGLVFLLWLRRLPARLTTRDARLTPAVETAGVKHAAR